MYAEGYEARPYDCLQFPEHVLRWKLDIIQV